MHSILESWVGIGIGYLLSY